MEVGCYSMYAANDIASVILKRNGWLDAMSLQKLLYYVQAWHLAITDQPLFEEKIKAWKDGPVVPQVWHERKDQASRRASAQDVSHLELDELSSELIDLVLASYGSMSGEELSTLTHAESPWLDARGGLPADAECRASISNDAMATFYRDKNRRLGGRTAADWAAGGVYCSASGAVGPVDVDELLSNIDAPDEQPDDPWGGANLDHLRSMASL